MVPFCLVNDYFFHCRSRLVYSSVASLTRKMYAMASSDAKFVIFVMLHYCGVCMLICEFMVIEPETFEMNKKKAQCVPNAEIWHLIENSSPNMIIKNSKRAREQQNMSRIETCVCVCAVPVFVKGGKQHALSLCAGFTLVSHSYFTPRTKFIYVMYIEIGFLLC